MSREISLVISPSEEKREKETREEVRRTHTYIHFIDAVAEMSGAQPSSSTLEERYAEIARKTAEAIQAEGPPAAGPKIQPVLQDLPRYEPPIPRKPDRERFDQICRMFFPTSGHMGFGLVQTSEELPPLEIVQQMILYETRLRLSDSIQGIMDEYHTDEADVT